MISIRPRRSGSSRSVPSGVCAHPKPSDLVRPRTASDEREKQKKQNCVVYDLGTLLGTLWGPFWDPGTPLGTRLGPKSLESEAKMMFSDQKWFLVKAKGCLGGVSGAFPSYFGIVWELFGYSFRVVWRLFGCYFGGVWMLFWSCFVVVWGRFRGCFGCCCGCFLGFVWVLFWGSF